MMDQMTPCTQTSNLMHGFIVIMNVVQSIALAIITQRSMRKNREERRANGHKVE